MESFFSCFSQTKHYSYFITSSVASQITGVWIIYSTVFRRRSKKTSKLRVTGLYEGNSAGIGDFPAQRASNVENLSIWWRHHAYLLIMYKNSEVFRTRLHFIKHYPMHIWTVFWCLSLCSSSRIRKYGLVDNFCIGNQRSGHFHSFPLMDPTWGPPGSCRPQVGSMLAPWTLLSGVCWGLETLFGREDLSFLVLSY